MDMMALAGRAVGLPHLSRRWGAQTAWIAPLLDLGLAGVMVPHVLDARHAETVCDSTRFSRGIRGLSPSPRAGNYGGMSIQDYKEASDAASVIALQIEDESALDHLDEIAAIKDVDLLFIGPADLSQSMGVEFPSPQIDDAIERIVSAARRAGIAAGLFVGDPTRISAWRDKGVSLFVCGSDQAFLRGSVGQLISTGRRP